MQSLQKFFPKYSIALGILFVITVAYLVIRGGSVDVEVSEAATGELVQAIYATGFVEAAAVAELSAEYSGTVSNVGAREGEPVQEGQAIVVIESPQPELALREMEAAVAAQEAVVRDSRRNYQRRENLYRQGALSRQDFDTASRVLTEAKELLLQKYSRLGIARDEFDKLTVRAPFDGILVFRDVEKGDYVKSGAVVATVVDTTHYAVTVEVDELDVPRIRSAQDAVVAFDAFPQKRFKAKVSRVVPQTDRVTKTSRVYLELAESPGIIQEGMTVTANIIWSVRAAVLLVRRGAVFSEGGSQWVWRVVDGRLKKQPVRIGASDLNFAEVLEGLSAGDMVVATPEARFREGLDVHGMPARNR